MTSEHWALPYLEDEVSAFLLDPGELAAMSANAQWRGFLMRPVSLDTFAMVGPRLALNPGTVCFHVEHARLGDYMGPMMFVLSPDVVTLDRAAAAFRFNPGDVVMLDKVKAVMD